MSFTPAYERPKIEDVAEGERTITIGTAETPKKYWLDGCEIYPAGISDPEGVNCRLRDHILVFVLEKQDKRITPGTYLPVLVRDPKPEEKTIYPEPTKIAIGLHVLEIGTYDVFFHQNGKVKPFAQM